MAKIALLFVAAFCLVQIGMSAHIQKRDTSTDVEITTPSIFDSLKTGLQKTFSEENLNKGRKALEDLGEKVKGGAQTFISNVSETVGKALNKDETTAAPAPAE